MQIICRSLALVLLITLIPLLSLADPGSSPNKEQVDAYFKQQIAKLHPQHGKISLKGNLATLNLPQNFGYLPPDETEILIHDIWQNPPGHKTLGAIIPGNIDLLSPASWAVIITYSDDGHIKDDDAATIDYDKLLEQMKAANAEESRKRKEEGYAAFALKGWATKPHYDKDAHKLYWAVELQSENSDETSINYNIRILGREGYLVMSIVGSLAQLPMIEANKDKILSFVDFNTNSRYSDFNPETDKVAAYGMAALVAGYAAAKVGMFKALIPILIALKKFIILIAVAIAAFFKKLFGRKKGKKD